MGAPFQEATKQAFAFLPPHLAVPHLSDVPSLLSRFVFVSHDELPEGIQFVPSACRIIAAMLVMPVCVLTVVDLLGWFFFKSLLRPLGYASTYVVSPLPILRSLLPVRFKDPEPRSMLVPATEGIDASNGSPVMHSGMLPSTSSSSSSASETSSAPSSPETATRPLPSISAEAELSSANEAASTNASPFTTEGPPLSPRSSLHRSRSQHPPTRRSSSHTSGQKQKRSLSSDSATFQLERKMNRDRAASVGLDGPLFESDANGATTPGAESEGEMSAGEYWGARSAGEGRPKGGFKLGLTEVRQRG
ncbi:hypothetical protein JCM11251_004687 [Rhodosporidiobolus azoricus]